MVSRSALQVLAKLDTATGSATTETNTASEQASSSSLNKSSTSSTSTPAAGTRQKANSSNTTQPNASEPLSFASLLTLISSNASQSTSEHTELRLITQNQRVVRALDSAFRYSLGANDSLYSSILNQGAAQTGSPLPSSSSTNTTTAAAEQGPWPNSASDSVLSLLAQLPLSVAEPLRRAVQLANLADIPLSDPVLRVLSQAQLSQEQALEEDLQIKAQQLVDASGVFLELGAGNLFEMENWDKLIESFDPWNEQKIAACIRMMANSTPSSSFAISGSRDETETSLRSMLVDLFSHTLVQSKGSLSLGLNPDGSLAGADKLQPASSFDDPTALDDIANSAVRDWDIEKFVDAVKKRNPTLDWMQVASLMDADGFVLADVRGLERITRAYTRATGAAKFPAEALIGRTWNNVRGQVSFLAIALASPRSFVSFDTATPRVSLTAISGSADSGFDGSKSGTPGPGGAFGGDGLVAKSSANKVHEMNWSAIPLVDTILSLAETPEGSIGSAQKLFEIPLRYCPEVLVLSLAASMMKRSALRKNLLAALVPSYVGSQPNSLGVVRSLWKLDMTVVIDSMVELWLLDQGNLPRLLDLIHELKALPDVLSWARPFEFSIDLAVLASRREYLNLEKWINGCIVEHGAPFVEACIMYLSKKTESSTPDSGMLFSLEATAVIFKCLHTSVGIMSYELVEKLKKLYASCIRANPRLAIENAGMVSGAGAGPGIASSTVRGPSPAGGGMSGADDPRPQWPGSSGMRSQHQFVPGGVGESFMNSSGVVADGTAASDSGGMPRPGAQEFSDDVDLEANFHFQRIYSEALSIDEAVELLRKLKDSPERRDQDVFACMIHNLFDEYRFFSKYPERELRITGMLFGVLVQHQLVASITLGIALRYILEALRKSPPGKLTKFGLCALDQFKYRLRDWPQYCSHLLQIEHIKTLAPELYQIIQNQLAQNVGSVGGGDRAYMEAGANMSVAGAGGVGGDLFSSSTGGRADEERNVLGMANLKLEGSQEFSSGSQVTYNGGASTDVSKTAGMGLLGSSSGPSSTPEILGDQIVLPQLGGGEAGESVEPKPVPTVAVIRNIPGESEQDKVHFIFNNLSVTTLDAKSKEVVDVLKPDYEEWLANYIVVKRASIEPNFHSLYFSFVEKLDPSYPKLIETILSRSIENVRMLLSSERIRQSSSERTLLKNLGAWIGMLTLQRNKPLLAKLVDLKSLVIRAYSSSLLIAVIPFVAKILESCEKSKVFRPPNPWLMAIMGVLRELYNLPDLKLNLKFEVEVLCKNIQIDLKEIKASELLKVAPPPPRRDNPDFNLKKSAFTSPNASPIKSSPSPTPLRSGESSMLVPRNITTSPGATSAASPLRASSPALNFFNQQQFSAQQAPQNTLSQQLASGGQGAGSTGSNVMMVNVGAMGGYHQGQQQQQPSVVQQSQAQSQQAQQQFSGLQIPSSASGMGRASPSPPPMGANPMATAFGVNRADMTVPSGMSNVGLGLGGSTLLAGGGSLGISAPQAMHMAATASPANAAAASAAAAMAAASAEGVTVIPNLGRHISVNPSLILFQTAPALKRLLPVAVDRAVREIIQPILERSCLISGVTTRELVLKDFAMETDINKVRKAAHQMVQYLAGSLALVTCNEPLRVSMANHLRTLLTQSSVDQSILEQTVQVVVAENLEMACAIIERAATERAIRDIDEAIIPAFTAMKERMLAEGTTDSNAGLMPGSLRVYDDFDKASKLVASTAAAAVAAAAAAAANAGARSITPSAGALDESVIKMTAQAPGVVGSEPVDLNTSTGVARGFPPPMTLDNAKSADGNLVQQHMPQDMLQQPLVGASGEYTSMSLNEVREMFEKLYAYLIRAIEAQPAGSELSDLSQDNPVNKLWLQVPTWVRNSASPDESGFMIAQKVFKYLYDGRSKLYTQVHVAILEKLRESCKRLPKELAIWMSFMEDYKKLDRDTTVALLSRGVLNVSDYDMMLSKFIDGGRNSAAVDFAAFIIQVCIVDNAYTSVAEMSNTVDALGKYAARLMSSYHEGTAPPPDSPSAKIMALIDRARKRTTSAVSSAPRNDLGSAVLPDEPSVPGARKLGGSRDMVSYIIIQWTFMYEASRTSHSVSDQVVSAYVNRGHQILRNEETREPFIRASVEVMVLLFQSISMARKHDSDLLRALAANARVNLSEDVRASLPDVIQLMSLVPDANGNVPFSFNQELSSVYCMVDAFSKLVSAVLRIEPNRTKADEILYNVLGAIIQSILSIQSMALSTEREGDDGSGGKGDLRVHFRLLSDLFRDLAPRVDDKSDNAQGIQILVMFANALHALQPARAPLFAFAWVELLAHRHFMPRILTSKQEQGWALYHQLILHLLSFLAPHLRALSLSDSMRAFYKGALRVLLVLLHDFPEFLCDYHFSLCDEIPPNCVQLRNLVLSAFPRSMRLPDPFLPDLKVDTLPEMSAPPRVLSKFTTALATNNLKAIIDNYLKVRSSVSISQEIISRLLTVPPGGTEAVTAPGGPRYHVRAINSLVFYVGQLAISQTQNSPITMTPHMDLFRSLVNDFDPEGRYHFLNAIANQLRFPNNHTHYFSVSLLYMFADAKKEIIQEQIIRVLMERLIANRPHPWGLLVTFIELIKNPRYNFWGHNFVRCTPEIQRLFETVARSCIGES